VEVLTIHPTHPQERLIQKAVDILKRGGVIVYPTDSGYALGCQIGDKEALERIRCIRQLDENHHFTLMCRDLSEIGSYGYVNNLSFRVLRDHTPGAYTFILSASKEVPRRLQYQKRKTVGFRIPSNPIALALMELLAYPLMSASLILPGDEQPLSDRYEIAERLQGQVDLMIDGGDCGTIPTTIVDLTTDVPKIIRRGRGDVSDLE